MSLNITYKRSIHMDLGLGRGSFAVAVFVVSGDRKFAGIVLRQDVTTPQLSTLNFSLASTPAQHNITSLPRIHISTPLKRREPFRPLHSGSYTPYQPSATPNNPLGTLAPSLESRTPAPTVPHLVNRLVPQLRLSPLPTRRISLRIASYSS